MASKKKLHKKRKMLARPYLKLMKAYGHKFKCCIYGPWDDNIEIHIIFDDLPAVEMVVTSKSAYGEHVAFLDKLRPDRVSMHWYSVREMMEFVDKSIRDYRAYQVEISRIYHAVGSWNLFYPVERDAIFGASHNHLGREEYYRCLRMFNEVINEVDVLKYDVIWTKSNSFRRIYDIYIYPAVALTEEDIIAIEDPLLLAMCDVFICENLPKNYWAHNGKYKKKIHPENKELYTSRTKFISYYGFNK